MQPSSVVLGLDSICKHRDLLKSLVRREIEGKYRATTLGLLWIIIYPLMMLGVYTFVFGGVFGSRWNSGGDWSTFVPMLYCGLIVHALFAETVSKAPYLIVNHPNYVKKVIFPLELLPVGGLLTALFNALINVALLLLFMAAFQKTLHWTICFLPVVLLPLVLLAIGLAWLIAALGVFFRDIEQVIGVLMSVLLFLSPVFYATASAPPLAQQFLAFNPLSYPIEDMRNIMLLGHLPHWWPWLLNTLSGLGIAWAGLWVFEQSRPAFADVV